MSRRKPTNEELDALVTGIVAGYLRDLNLDASGKSGRIKVEVEVCLSNGEVPWSTGTVYFEERRNYHE